MKTTQQFTPLTNIEVQLQKTRKELEYLEFEHEHLTQKFKEYVRAECHGDPNAKKAKKQVEEQIIQCAFRKEYILFQLSGWQSKYEKLTLDIGATYLIENVSFYNRLSYIFAR